MKYILICKENYGIAKGKTYIDCSENEIEIDEELYNTIQCPCTFTLTAGKLATWEQCNLPNDLFPIIPTQPTEKEILEQRLTDADLKSISQGQMQTDLDLRIIEQEKKINVLMIQVGGAK